MMICKTQIRLKSLCPWGSKNDDGGKYNSRKKNVIPLIQPTIQPLMYIPLIQPSLKLQPMTQYQVYGFLDFTVKSLITTNCYDS